MTTTKVIIMQRNHFCVLYFLTLDLAVVALLFSLGRHKRALYHAIKLLHNNDRVCVQNSLLTYRCYRTLKCLLAVWYTADLITLIY